MFYAAESVSQTLLSRQAAERYAQLQAVREQKAKAKQKKRVGVRSEVVKAA